MIREVIREYFAPLRQRWFWKYAFPIVLIAAMVVAWADFDSPAALRCEAMGGMYSVFNGGIFPFQSGCYVPRRESH